MTYYLENGDDKGIAHETPRGISFFGKTYKSIDQITALGWIVVPAPY